ncbi:MAG: AMP-binding protein [Mycoplasmataceae bacterium]|nr:AMP-binding protein [Mycoplasmataceae bacterium]
MNKYKKVNQLISLVLTNLKQSPSSFASIKEITLAFFKDNIFAEYQLNGVNQQLTYQNMFALATHVSNNILSKHIVTKGDIVLRMHNSPNWYIAFWGIIGAGFKPILVKPEIDNEYLKTILTKISVADEINDTNFHHWNTPNDKIKRRTEYATEVAFLSSGTTNIPKVVTYDVASLISQISIASEILKHNKMIRLGNWMKDANKIKILAFLPLHHIFGFIVIVIWFSFFGRTIVFLKDLSPETIRTTCTEHKVTHFFAVPMVWENVVNSLMTEATKQKKQKQLLGAINLGNFLQNILPKTGNYIVRNLLFKRLRKKILGENLRFLISGGAMINERYLKVLNGLGYAVHNGYGLTESGIISVELSKYPRFRNKLTVGKPFKIVQWKINQQNELLLKGNLLFKSKMESGQLTVNNKDEWYNTHDVARVKNNRLMILGRSDNVIIGADGENINPEELENLFNIDKRYQCAILGIKQRSGSHQINLIILFKNVDQTTQTLLIKKIKEIANHLSLYQRPTKYYLVDKLPLTELGKIQHQTLVELYENHKLKLVPCTSEANTNLQFVQTENVQNLLIIIRKCYAKIFNTSLNDIHDNTNFIYDLGGSSLDYYSLLNEIYLQINKEIKLSGSTVLLTPLDFALFFTKN